MRSKELTWFVSKWSSWNFFKISFHRLSRPAHSYSFIEIRQFPMGSIVLSRPLLRQKILIIKWINTSKYLVLRWKFVPFTRRKNCSARFFCVICVLNEMPYRIFLAWKIDLLPCIRSIILSVEKFIETYLIDKKWSSKNAYEWSLPRSSIELIRNWHSSAEKVLYSTKQTKFFSGKTSTYRGENLRVISKGIPSFTLRIRCFACSFSAANFPTKFSHSTSKSLTAPASDIFLFSCPRIEIESHRLYTPYIYLTQLRETHASWSKNRTHSYKDNSMHIDSINDNELIGNKNSSQNYIYLIFTRKSFVFFRGISFVSPFRYHQTISWHKSFMTIFISYPNPMWMRTTKYLN